jgi:hypothetical protein
MNLVIAPCTHEAAKYAVMNWHYSKSMPSGKLVSYGVWEQESFRGAVIYGRGATPFLLTPYNLDQTQGCELVRIALTQHQTPVSQIVAQTIKLLKQNNPNLRLIVSFADPSQGHAGGIYQAGNWIYTGQSSTAKFLKDKRTGKIIHPRTIQAAKKSGRNMMGDSNYTPIMMPGKFRYLYPLDKQMRRKIDKSRQPYPHAVEGSKVSRDTSGIEVQVRSLPTAPQSNAKE